MAYKDVEKRRLHDREYYIKNQESIKIKKRKYNQEHKEERKEYNKKYRIRNRKKLLKYEKQYRKDNFEKIKEYNKLWCEENHEEINAYKRRYYHDKEKEKKRRYRKEHSGKKIIYNKEYYQANKEEIKKCTAEYRQNHKGEHNKNFRKRYRVDLKFNLNYKMRGLIKQSLKGNKNNKKWEEMIDYKFIELIDHLTRTMPKGYTWQDYLNGDLQIDHIIPIKVFNFTKPEHVDFKRCWGLKNLRLLSTEENRKKGCKIDEPFQPALII